MDPANELATLVVSYLWPLRDMFRHVHYVAGFQDELEKVEELAAADFALLSRLRDVAERTHEERWEPRRVDRRDPVDLGTRLSDIIKRGEQRQSSSPSSSSGSPSSGRRRTGTGLDVTKLHHAILAREELRQFQQDARWLADGSRLGKLQIRRDEVDASSDLTREEFTQTVHVSLLCEQLLGQVAFTLNYRPLLIREMTATRSRWEWLRDAPRYRALLDDPQYPSALLAELGDEHALPFELVLHRELEEIDKLRQARCNLSPPAPELAPATTRAYSRGLFGVALSGGGVRSATFALGVLQGLANHKWLPQIDYLSTVSGGGYVGAWLLAWAKRRGSIHAVQDSLRGYGRQAADAPGAAQALLPFVAGQPASNAIVRSPDPNAEHVRPIRQLREYSNYLAPRFSTFSSDTWTMVSIWGRNTVLNLLVLTLFMMGAVMLPRVLAGMFIGASTQLALISCWAALALASAFIGLNLSTFEVGPASDARGRAWVVPRASSFGRGDTSLLVVATIVVPSFVALLFAVRALVAYEPPNAGETESSHVFAALWKLATAFSFAGLVNWFSLVWTAMKEAWNTPLARVRIFSFLALWTSLALAAVLGQHYRAPAGLAPAHQPRRYRLMRVFKRLALSLIWAAIAAGVGAIILAELWEHAVPWLYLESRRGTWFAMAFGPGVLIVVISTVLVLYLGLEGRGAADERREWWSRLGGWMNLMGAGWAFGAIVSYFSPYVLASQTVYLGSLGSVWVSITAAGAWLGASGKSNGINLPLDRNRLSAALIAIAPYVFILGFFVSVTVLTHGLMYFLTRHYRSEGEILLPFSFLRYAETYWANLDPLDPLPPIVCGTLLALAFGLAWRVDVNEFSMHHFYRNRLIRAFLGASRSQAHRRPNAFTGLDMDDDVKLWRLTHDDRTLPNDERTDCRARFVGPYSIINATLNITTGDELAYQERKGRSFVFTPLYCGYDFASKQTLESEKVAAEFAFRPTRFFANAPSAKKLRRSGLSYSSAGTAFTEPVEDWGVSIGTAAAISGAAANPNAGYHSSPSVAFLLTVFNARLGWWLGNPRLDKWTQPSPRLGLGYLLSELFGFSGVQRDYVNLSDGGHFDNMGLYELVRRRCRYIVLCDGEQDDQYSFNGLAGAIRKCRVDFGVVIDIDTKAIHPRKSDRTSQSHVAVGTITYPGEGFGTLVYIKASLTGDEPADVKEYQQRHAEFPHQTTRDQFFDESQFESYRALGQHIADKTFSAWPGRTPQQWHAALDSVFAALKSKYKAPSPSAGA